MRTISCNKQTKTITEEKVYLVQNKIQLSALLSTLIFLNSICIEIHLFFNGIFTDKYTCILNGSIVLEDQALVLLGTITICKWDLEHRQ
jgi:hypothetical protein